MGRRNRENRVLAILAKVEAVTVPEIMLIGGFFWLAPMYTVLWRLELEGRVTSEFMEMPYPRQRLYRLAGPRHVD